MNATAPPKSSRLKVREHQRQQGLRPISWRRPVAYPAPWRPVPMQRRIRLSSTRSPTGMTREARVGRLDDEDILRLNRAMLVFLGLAISPRAQR